MLLPPSVPAGMPSDCHISDACRVCGHSLAQVLSLGPLALANALVFPGVPIEAQQRFPLTLTFCSGCGLVQLAETVAPELLFRHYVYQSSTSAEFVAHAEALAARMIATGPRGRDSRVIEIASNDGYLLQYYRRAGMSVLGVDPAGNIAAIAEARGIETVVDFFSARLAEKLSAAGHRADIVHAHNVLAHVADPNDVAKGIRLILAPGGVAVIEVPYVRDLIERLAFDTIYHEHLCYFALAPLITLFARAGLAVVDVERLPVHAGTLRLFLRRQGECDPRAAVQALLAEEEQWGVFDPGTYQDFAAAVQRFRPALRNFLEALRAGGKSLAAYGASAKGATLLGYCGVDHKLIDFVVDRSCLKQGLAMPGVGVPILAPEALRERRPDYLLLLAWNFAQEIARQQADYTAGGGRYILPFPRPHVLEHSP